MKFKNEVLMSGRPNKFRWRSDCGTYSIGLYDHFNNRYSAPYCVGYLSHNGRRITDSHGLDFEGVVEQIEAFNAAAASLDS